jgi:uncharacterized protein (DUF4415 family)
MRKKDDTVSYTLDEINAMRRRGEDLTDWERVKAMTEEELEASIAADPDDIHEELDWTKAFKGLPPRKKDIHIRIDSDVLHWFKQSGEGYQTRMNNVLRAFFESRQRSGAAKPVRGKVKRAKPRRVAN